MALISLIEAFLVLFCFLVFCYFLNKKTFNYLHIKKTYQSFPWNWPVLGMLPGVLVRLRQMDDLITVMENSNMTFLFKGPWFTKINALVTVDPANIHHIFSSSFSNYIKGPELKGIFDVFGDAIFNTDAEMWKKMRTSLLSLVHHQGFQRLSMNTTKSKVKDELLPLFNHHAEEGTIVDLQDVFGRFTYDTTIAIVTGSDPRSLSIDMSKIDEFAKAFDDAADAVLYRHILPKWMLKLQSWIGFGLEKKMTDAGATFDRVCAKYVSDKIEEMSSQGIITHHSKNEGGGDDILTSLIKLDTTNNKVLNSGDDTFFRDMILSFVLAGRDTIASALTWFFWLISKNPNVVTKIRKEMSYSSTDPKEFLNNLVYLHGALYEAMRLYPPVPFERKSPVKQDVLPSGHEIEANSDILIPIYALGENESHMGRRRKRI